MYASTAELRHFLASFLVLVAVALPWTCRGQCSAAPAPGKEVFVLSGHTVEVFTVAYSADGKLLASGSNREVKVWDALTGKEVFTYPIKGQNVYGLAFSPDGKRLAVGISRVVKLLETAKGTELGSATVGNFFLFRMAFSPDGKRLALAGGNLQGTGEVRLCEADTCKEIFAHRQDQAVLNVAFSADGRLLASVGGSTNGSKAGTVIVWDAVTGRQRHRLVGHSDTIYGVAFSPDGRRLATGSGGSRGSTKPGTVKTWELATGKELAQLGGHNGPIFGVVFSPDGRRLATASGDRTVKVREVVTGQELLSISAHAGTIYSLAFSPDGRRLATVSQDKLLKVWNVAGPSPAARPGGSEPRLRMHWTATEREMLWAHLSGADAVRAHRSLSELVEAPELAVPWFRSRIRPVPGLDNRQQRQAARWLRDLDHDEFEVREKAAAELARLGESVLPQLRQALAGTPSLDVKRRLESLIEDQAEPTFGPEQLAAVRAVEALEWIGNAEARTVLKELASGLPDARLTREAQAALDRLGRQPVSP